MEEWLNTLVYGIERAAVLAWRTETADGIVGVNIEGRTGASTPFGALGSAFSRAGAGTGRRFSRGASVASAVSAR